MNGNARVKRLIRRGLPSQRSVIWLLASCLSLLSVIYASLATSAPPQHQALLMTIDGAIGPATVDYLQRALDKAKTDQDEVLIIELDTPGGLVDSMRDMVKAILASPVPVVTYVSPPGSRAASAGTYLMYASHIAAMAPATHLGSATPVELGIPGLSGDSGKDESSGGSAMQHKILEDAVSFIRSLAERRGRNADWAEKAVRQAANLDAKEALKQNVIDVVATSVNDLLQQIDGRQVMMAQQPETLHTRNVSIVRFDPDWRTEFLSTITNPNIAYFLLLAGLIGLAFELLHPGTTVPGVVGGICLLLALFAFQLLSVNYAGLALILLGLGFIVAEAFVPSFGVLGLGGIVAFVSGSVMLMDGLHRAVSIPLIGGVALIAATFLLWLFSRLISLRRRPPATGEQQMVGLSAQALEDFQPVPEEGGWRGRVRVRGENWQARSGGQVRAGDTLDITAVQGLRLQVAPAHPSSDTTSHKQGEQT